MIALKNKTNTKLYNKHFTLQCIFDIEECTGSNFLVKMFTLLSGMVVVFSFQSACHFSGVAKRVCQMFVFPVRNIFSWVVSQVLGEETGEDCLDMIRLLLSKKCYLLILFSSICQTRSFMTSFFHNFYPGCQIKTHAKFTK